MDLSAYPSITTLSQALAGYQHLHHWLKAAEHSDLKLLTYKEAPEVLEEPMRAFLLREKAVIAFPLSIMSKQTGYAFRSLGQKNFRSSLNIPSMYLPLRSRLKLTNFTFGSTIFLTEGVVDSECVAAQGHFSAAYLTSTVSRRMAEIISAFTNRVVIVPDNDNSGREGVRKSYYSLKSAGISNIEVTFPPNPVKDCGDLYKPEFESFGPLMSAQLAIHTC
jgi:hypothetical protein